MNREHCFNPSEIALYFHLVNVSNSLGWKNPFKEGHIHISASIGLSEPTIQRARERLVKADLLSFKSGKVKRELTEYLLIEGKSLGESLGKNNLHLSLHQSEHLTIHQSDTQPFTQPLDNNKQKQKLKPKQLEKRESAVILPFDSDDFKSAWSRWLEYRKDKKITYSGGMTEQVAAKNLYKISKNNEQTAIDIIDQSIGNDWQTFYELKNNSGGKPAGGKITEQVKLNQEQHERNKIKYGNTEKN